MSGSNNGISFSLGGTTSSNAAPGRGRGMQGGKLAFGFSGNRGPGAKRLATPAAAVFETPGSDDEEDIPASNDKRRRVNEGVSSTQEPTASSAGPQPPSDPNVLKVADKLAAFVAKNGDSFEGVTKERNPGDTPFRFLFDKSCNDYMWYRMKVKEYRGEASEPAASSQQPLPGPNSQSPTGGQKDASGEAVNTLRGAQETEEARRAQEAISKGDSLAAMNAYMKLAAKHEEKRGPVKDTREMPPPDTLTDTGREKTFAVYKDDGSRGHHMGDFIPKEEMDRFLAKQGDPAAQARLAAQELANRIGADNKGHQMLQKMGWTEGSGLGAGQAGLSTPLSAGEAKQDNLGVGAASTHEVSGSEDIYEAYKKRMMLGYKYRPNPLGNPRKQYY
uniref:Splicing factor 4 n=1 Tax=Tetraselmis sp. GSL018 TaxID=582737 RepID=A0A061QN24_9CHLO